MAAILNNLQEGDVLFVDEIHRLNRQVEEVLYPAMEDFAIDIMIGKGCSARSIRLELPRFTLVGATTRAGLLTAPLRDRSVLFIIWSSIQIGSSSRSFFIRLQFWAWRSSRREPWSWRGGPGELQGLPTGC